MCKGNCLRDIQILTKKNQNFEENIIQIVPQMLAQSRTNEMMIFHHTDISYLPFNVFCVRNNDILFITNAKNARF